MICPVRKIRRRIKLEKQAALGSERCDVQSLNSSSYQFSAKGRLSTGHQHRIAPLSSIAETGADPLMVLRLPGFMLGLYPLPRHATLRLAKHKLTTGISRRQHQALPSSGARRPGSRAGTLPNKAGFAHSS